MNSRMASNAAGFASLWWYLPLMVILGNGRFCRLVLAASLVAPGVGVAILAAGLKLYSYLLDRAAAYTYDHLEEIAGNLGA